MLKIRFFKTGRKNHPFYRIVVTDSRNAPQGGRFREKVGFFNPLTKEKGLNRERIEHWLSLGAQPSPRVHNLLIDEGVITGSKINVLKKVAAETPEGEPAQSTTEQPEQEKPSEGPTAEEFSQPETEQPEQAASEEAGEAEKAG